MEGYGKEIIRKFKSDRLIYRMNDFGFVNDRSDCGVVVPTTTTTILVMSLLLLLQLLIPPSRTVNPEEVAYPLV